MDGVQQQQLCPVHCRIDAAWGAEEEARWRRASRPPAMVAHTREATARACSSNSSRRRPLSAAPSAPARSLDSTAHSRCPPVRVPLAHPRIRPAPVAGRSMPPLLPLVGKGRPRPPLAGAAPVPLMERA
ncbi:unnamed protein product [Urochloa humidicola]